MRQAGALTVHEATCGGSHALGRDRLHLLLAVQFMAVVGLELNPSTWSTDTNTEQSYSATQRIYMLLSMEQ